MIIISKKIRELRKLLGISQKEFAKKMGVPQQNVNRWEKGMVYPGIENLFKISKLFNVSIDWLITGEGYPFKKIRYSKADLKRVPSYFKRLPFNFYLRYVIEKNILSRDYILERMENLVKKHLTEEFPTSEYLDKLIEGEPVEPFLYDFVLEIIGFSSWEEFLYKTEFKYFLPIKYIPVTSLLTDDFPFLSSNAEVEDFFPFFVNFPGIAGFIIKTDIPEIGILKNDILFVEGKENTWKSEDIVLLKIFKGNNKVEFKVKKIYESYDSVYFLLPPEEEFISIKEEKVKRGEIEIYKITGIFRNLG